MRAKQMSQEDIALLLKLKLRIPDVTADAAYAIVTRDSRSYTQHFCIDEDILKEEGITDFEQYAAPRPSKHYIWQVSLICNLFTYISVCYFLSFRMGRVVKKECYLCWRLSKFDYHSPHDPGEISLTFVWFATELQNLNFFETTFY